MRRATVVMNAFSHDVDPVYQSYVKKFAKKEQQVLQQRQEAKVVIG